jgi:hypothetical protein
VEEKFPRGMTDCCIALDRVSEQRILAEVDKRLDDCQRNWKAAVESTIEAMEGRILDKVAKATMKAIRGLNADSHLMAEHLKWVADILANELEKK